MDCIVRSYYASGKNSIIFSVFTICSSFISAVPLLYFLLDVLLMKSNNSTWN